ncbi:MAG: hypothetical protein FD180_2731 [Planctomycetota bacterium]|nr:MAG: hypothetical protein FD180_2731 [Planctomycetota bacterium]
MKGRLKKKVEPLPNSDRTAKLRAGPSAERQENAFLEARLDADPVVRDEELPEVSFTARFDPDPRRLRAAVLERVGNQVLEYFGQLNRVGGDLRKLSLGHEGAALLDQRPEVEQRLAQGVGGEHRAENLLPAGAPRELEEAHDQRPHPACAVNGVAHEFVRVRGKPGTELFVQELHVARHHSKRLLQVVGSDVSEALEVFVGSFELEPLGRELRGDPLSFRGLAAETLVRLSQLARPLLDFLFQLRLGRRPRRFREPPFGHVARDDQHARDAPADHQRPADRLKVAPESAPGLRPDDRRRGGFASERRGRGLFGLREVVRVHELRVVLSEPVLPAPAQRALERGVEGRNQPVGRHGHDQFVGALEQLPIFLFGMPKQFFRAPSLADVPKDVDEVGGAPLGVQDDRGARGHVNRRPIPPDARDLRRVVAFAHVRDLGRRQGGPVRRFQQPVDRRPDHLRRAVPEDL